MQKPVLYSYRRCPYAMRARMALRYAGIDAEIREIELRNKPLHMIQLSPKATVPVLLLESGEVLEESLDIMRWALQQRDADGWRLPGDPEIRDAMEALILVNDREFKQALDRYKYPERYPDFPIEHYRQQGEVFLHMLEDHLLVSACLFGDALSMADIAIFPFIRQFAGVDSAWFNDAPYPRLRGWLEARVQSTLFTDVMQKNPVWIAH